MGTRQPRSSGRALSRLAVAIIPALLGCTININKSTTPQPEPNKPHEAKHDEHAQAGGKTSEPPKPHTGTHETTPHTGTHETTPHTGTHETTPHTGTHETNPGTGTHATTPPVVNPGTGSHTTTPIPNPGTGTVTPVHPGTGTTTPVQPGTSTGSTTTPVTPPITGGTIGTVPVIGGIGAHTNPGKDASDISHLLIPLRIPFDQALAKIEALVPKTEEEKDWKRVTKEGESPEVEIHYTVWRDKIKAALDNGTLTVTVPLHYAANFRAKVQNPVMHSDWIWLTHDDTWGTKQQPQDLTVTVVLKPHVEPTWTIKSDMKLEPLVHGPAPTGDVCVKVGLKACVSRETIAPKVRAHIDAYITPKLEDALKKVDGELDKLLKVKEHAEQVWNALQQPQSLSTVAQAKCPTEFGQACKLPAWVVAAPSSIGIGTLTMDKKDARIDLDVSGKLAAVVGDKPAVPAHALPKLGTASGTPEAAVNIELRMSRDVLGAALAKGLAALKIAVTGKPALTLKGASITAEHDPKDPHKVTITAQAQGPVNAELKLSGDFNYDPATQQLSVTGFNYDANTAALLKKEVGEADLEALKKQITDKAKWDLSGQVKALSKSVFDAMNKAIKGQLTLSGDLNQVSLHDFAVNADGLTVHLGLKGKVEAKYTPK